jgi:hypothetical protein
LKPGKTFVCKKFFEPSDLPEADADISKLEIKLYRTFVNNETESLRPGFCSTETELSG